MNTHLWRGRALRRIERDLTSSDPRLNMLFSLFTRLAMDEKMPRVETVGPLRRLARLGLRADSHRTGDDWRAWPRTIL